MSVFINSERKTSGELNSSATCRMLLIAQNGLFHSISSNYWQRRYWRGSIASTVLCAAYMPHQCLLHIVSNVLQYDLELVLMKNFHEFVHEYLQKPEFAELMRRLGALGDGRQDQSNAPCQLHRFCTPECCRLFPTSALIREMQVHCHKMSGRFPISISRLSCGRYCATRVFDSCWHQNCMPVLLTHSPFTARPTAYPTKSQQRKQRENVSHRG